MFLFISPPKPKDWLGILLGLLTLLALIPSPIFAKTLTAEVDRTEIEAGDILNLTLSADFQTDNTPNFDRLIDQFEVLGQQRSSYFQFINGSLSSETRWDLTLLPKQDGVLMIPPFEIEGIQSQPIKIHVQSSSQTPQEVGKKSAFFLSATVDNPTPYVQEEVHYRLRFFYQGQLIDGNLRAPQFKGTLSQLVTNQKSYIKQIQGQRYQVYEWDYVLYPQHSGDLKLAPAAFMGRAQWRGILKMLHLKSDSLTLKVRPKPTGYPANAIWLPAKKISLDLKTESHQVSAGETLNLTLTLTAHGLLSAQLPKVNFPQSSNYKLYLDHTEEDSRWLNGQMVSQKVFHYLLVPTQAGKLTFNPVTLSWWSLTKNQLEIAQTPALSLEVKPSPNLQPSAKKQKPNQVSHETSKAAQSPAKIPSPASQTDSFWLWASLIALLLLSLILLGRLWYTQKQLKLLSTQLKNQGQTEVAATQPLQSKIEKNNLCQKLEDLSLLQQCSRAEWIAFYQQAKQQLSEAKTTAEAVKQAFYQLKQHLFAKPEPLETLQPALNALCQALTSSRKKPKKPHPSTDKNTHLDKLYP